MTNPAKRVEQLRAEIRRHDHAYYVLAQPSISDLDYDRILEELRGLETEHPELLTADSPTQRIGDAPVEHLVQVDHSVPMLSIDNTYSREELQAYFDRTEKLLEGEPIEWVMEYKIDGVAASVRYESGEMINRATVVAAETWSGIFLASPSTSSARTCLPRHAIDTTYVRIDLIS